MEKYREFAARISFVMTLKGLKNKDIVAGYKKNGIVISSSAVSQFLSGRFSPTDERVELLAEILGVSTGWLQGRGKIDDVQELDEKELKKVLRRMRRIFIHLSPDSQRMAIKFLDFLELQGQSDDFIFQQRMFDNSKVKNRQKYFNSSYSLVSEDDIK